MIRTLYSWVFPRTSGFGQEVRSDTARKYRGHAARIIENLANASQDRAGLLSELRFLSANGGLDVEVQVDSDFDLLFPDERLFVDREHEQWSRDALVSAQSWAKQWTKGVELQLVRRLKWAEEQAASIDRTWPRLGPAVIGQFAATNPDLASALLELVSSEKLSGDYAAPLIEQLTLLKSSGWQDSILRAMDNQITRFVAIQCALKLGPGRLRETALGYLTGAYRNLIEFLVVRGDF